MKWAKWSGARTLGQEGNHHPERDFSTHTIPIPSSPAENKSTVLLAYFRFFFAWPLTEINLINMTGPQPSLFKSCLPQQVVPMQARLYQVLSAQKASRWHFPDGHE